MRNFPESSSPRWAALSENGALEELVQMPPCTWGEAGPRLALRIMSSARSSQTPFNSHRTRAAPRTPPSSPDPKGVHLSHLLRVSLGETEASRLPGPLSA